MRDNEIFGLLVATNPVPDPDGLDLPLALADFGERSKEMQTKLEELKPIETPRRRWIPALAAAVVVILVGVSIAVFTNNSEPAAAGGETSPVATALSFIAARDAWDGETVRSLVATDAVINGFVATADEYLTIDEFERATGWRFLEPNCTEGGSGAIGVRVLCTYTMENAWSQALGVGPFTGSNFDFVIAAGQIQELTHTFDFTQFSPQVWEVFFAWVSDSHLQDVVVMYDFSVSTDVPRRTPEAIALWEQYTDEFVEAQSGS